MIRNACLFACLALAACAAPVKHSKVVTPQKMSCSDGKIAALTLDSPDNARLNFQDKTYELKRLSTASGVKYGDGDISIWNKGISAMIERDGTVAATCTYIPRAGL